MCMASCGSRIVRLLLDAERLSDVPVRLQRALSAGVPAADKAAWVDGFFADGALLLIHDAELRGLLDDWVCQLDETPVRRHVAAATTDIRHLRCRRTSNDRGTDCSWCRESRSTASGRG